MWLTVGLLAAGVSAAGRGKDTHHDIAAILIRALRPSPGCSAKQTRCHWPGRTAIDYSRRLASAAGLSERKHAPVQRRGVELIKCARPTTDFYYSSRRLPSSSTITPSFWTQLLHHQIKLLPSAIRNFCMLYPVPPKNCLSAPCTRSATLTSTSRPDQTAHRFRRHGVLTSNTTKLAGLYIHKFSFVRPLLGPKAWVYGGDYKKPP
ncbi:hypothetical protein PSPO01_09661 [Paraphaeosphaeria sporulosa]